MSFPLKTLLGLVLFCTLLVAGFYTFNAFIYNEKQGGSEDYRAATFTIDGAPVTLVNGISEVKGLNDSATVTRYFGNEAKGDLNDDGVPDMAFLVTHNGGGSGTFVYVVVALQNAVGRYNGTNAILLGDRVAPQTTEIRNGILIVNYADRKPDEPMTAQPSVGISQYIYYDGTQLIAVPPAGPISIEGEMVCLAHKDSEGPQTLECAYGLHDAFDRYFALSDTDPEYKNISRVPMNTRVKVDGIFKLQLDSKYKDIGIIEVANITPL